MSRFGKLPVEIVKGASVEVSDDSVTVKGPKGELTVKVPRGVKVIKSNSSLTVTVAKKTKQNRALQGTIRSHLINAIHGVVEGWSKELELSGAGYRAEAKPEEVTLVVGFSHPISIKLPEGTKASVEKNIIKVEGANKEDVGLVAAKIKKVRPPNPYTGSGIKFVGEIIKKKAGKQAAKTE